MKSSIINLSITQLASAYIFVLIVLVLVKKRGIPKEKEIIISAIRMTIQLMLVGYILVYVFEQISPFFTLAIVSIMEIFAINNTFKRIGHELSGKLKKVIAGSMIIGTSISLFYFLIIIVGINPWYDPQYFIPIAGMIIGNAMTAVSLGATRLIEGFKDNKDQIEGALMIGGTPNKVSKNIVNQAFNSAILPTINYMFSIGIVSLPGMMTGQILSGTSPLIAIEYQLAIMLGILGSVSLSSIIFLNLGYRTFFNDRCQLIIDEER